MIQHREAVPTEFLIALAILFGILSVAVDPQRTVPAAIESKAGQEAGRIIRPDHRVDRLVPPGAKLENISDGLNWVEGPVCNHPEGYLLFSDIPDNAVCPWQPGKDLYLWLKPSGDSRAATFAGRGIISRRTQPCTESRLERREAVYEAHD